VVESLKAESCNKSKFLVFIRNGRIEKSRFRAADEERAVEADSCNPPREWRNPEKGAKVFLFQSAVTH
jgi:hypothetical protein